MGYCSDVMIVLSNKVMVDSLLGKPLPKMLNDADIVREYRTSEGQLISTFYYWEHARWYHPREIEDFLATLDDEDYGFIRIGEEDGDIEMQGNTWNYELHISTTIANPVGIP